MHKLLERQLKRQFGEVAAIPKELQAFIQAIDASYLSADEDRRLVERSLDLASQELLQSNADLRMKQREQQAIFNTVPAMIIYKDTGNRILRLNDAAAHALGGSQAQIEGKHTADLLPPEVAQRLFEDDLAVIQSGEPRLGIIETHPTADGQERWMRTDKVPYRDESGKVIGVIVFSVDITERKKAEDALRRSEERLKDALAQLREAERERTQFINNAAHELGTPLTPIKLQMHLVKGRVEKAHDPEQTRSVEILERNFERLSHLVKDLLDSARIQADSLLLEQQLVDLGALAKAAVDNYRDVAKQASVDITCDNLPALPVRVDSRRLGQVFDNLLSNAIKFTPPGGSVTVTAQREADQAIIRIQDTGMGMRPDAIPRLFKPFSQVHDVMQRTRGGTGLGLYICRGIMEASGGAIGVESPGIGKGATFWFRLPIHAVN